MDVDQSPARNPDDGPAFLDVDPPHWAARGLVYVLVLLFTLASIGSVVVKVPETVSGRFVLAPVRGADPVRSSRTGVVSEVRAVEGVAVSKGDALFVIHSQPVGDLSSELQTLQTRLRGAAESLANGRRQYENQRLADAADARRLQGRIDYLSRVIDLNKTRLALSNDLVERYKRSHAEGLTSLVDSTRPQLEADQLAVELEQSETERAEARAGIRPLYYQSEVRRAEYVERERSLREEIEKARIRIPFLERELAHGREDQLTVPAPCSGTVLRLAVKAPGAVVRDGEVLSEVACAGQHLQAELSIPQSGMALVKPGQAVKLLYDAFPYQRYGVKYGTVRWISPAAEGDHDAGSGATGVGENNIGAFRVLVDVADDSIVVKGESRPMRAGMGGQIDIVVGKRSLISYAFEPIRQLKENLAEGPPK